MGNASQAHRRKQYWYWQSVKRTVFHYLVALLQLTNTL